MTMQSRYQALACPTHQCGPGIACRTRACQSSCRSSRAAALHAADEAAHGPRQSSVHWRVGSGDAELRTARGRWSGTCPTSQRKKNILYIGGGEAGRQNSGRHAEDKAAHAARSNSVHCRVGGGNAKLRTACRGRSSTCLTSHFCTLQGGRRGGRIQDSAFSLFVWRISVVYPSGPLQHTRRTLDATPAM